MKVLWTEYLEFVDATSDKFYRAEVIEQDDGSFTTVVTYGKRGAAKPQSALKYGGTDMTAAGTAFNKAIAEKTKGGYQVKPDPNE